MIKCISLKCQPHEGTSQRREIWTNNEPIISSVNLCNQDKLDYKKVLEVVAKELFLNLINDGIGDLLIMATKTELWRVELDEFHDRDFLENMNSSELWVDGERLQTISH